MFDPSKPPHPDKNPRYHKLDFARNSVFHVAKVQFALFLSEGATLQEMAILVKQMQDSILSAYQVSAHDAAAEAIGPSPEPPIFGEDFSDDNPFSPE